MTAYVTGAATAAGLIIAIGAQNAYLLRLGLMRSHIGIAVLVCILTDVVLQSIGIAGLGSLIVGRERLLQAILFLGAAYLVYLGVSAFRRAFRTDALEAAGTAGGGRRGVLMGSLGVSLLNPHVYLDSVVTVGALAAMHGSDGRWVFGAGSLTVSALWFLCLGYGAARAAPWLARPVTWRLIEVVTGMVMIGLAVMLVTG